MRIDTAEGLMRRRDGNPRLRGAYRGYRKTHLSDFSFDTPFINDERKFHIDWQFQFQNIPTSATLDGLLLTDLITMPPTMIDRARARLPFFN
ncbi:MAG TPA: hypothetical protein VJR91_20675 [Burkholderia sp.]|nr:hypothetical protein [Burkholderia sp.]